MESIFAPRKPLHHVDAILHAIIVDVDPISRTFSASSFGGQAARLIHGITYAETQGDNDGIEKTPKRGWLVRLKEMSDASFRLIGYGGFHVHVREPEDNLEKELNKKEGPHDARQKYNSIFLPGDFVHNVGDSWMAMLEGGIQSLGVSDLCQMFMFAHRNLFRLVTEEYEMMHIGGHDRIWDDKGSVSRRLLFTKSSASHYAGIGETATASSGDLYDGMSPHYEMQLDIGKLGNFIKLVLGEVPLLEDDVKPSGNHTGDPKDRPGRVDKLYFQMTERGGIHVLAGDDLGNQKVAWEFTLFGSDYMKDAEAFESKRTDRDHRQGDWEFVRYGSAGDVIYQKSMEVRPAQDAVNVTEKIVGNKTTTIEKGDWNIKIGEGNLMTSVKEGVFNLLANNTVLQGNAYQNQNTIKQDVFPPNTGAPE